MHRILFIVIFGGVSIPLFAARPFVTDDARLTTAGSCQLESWTRIYSVSQEFWALPACNPTGNFELTIGGGRAKSEGSQASNDYVFQAKTLFRSLDTNDFGVGIAIGTILHPKINPESNLLGNIYAYIPFSASFKDDKIIMHVNLGWLRDRASNDDRLTWGVGSELQLSSRFLAIAEAFGESKGYPFWQVGGRFVIIPDLLQVDATVGHQFSFPNSGRWISFGIRLTPARLF
ncbi:hypothetical protein [Nitrosomonas sp.]|uniref:hypothetical protein n=1 Tax=Nitrosomonas sp. TaxID=42353 RepID=UPI002617955E|nr:hypothetical protein [Nitrosomonas sp.]MCW5601894.1 hypothetical protein [Nitrosomonas sp.]